MKVISTNLSSPTKALSKGAVVVVMKVNLYFVVPLVNLHLTLNVRHYHKPQHTNKMSITSLSIIQLKMTLVNITVISVKKIKTETISSTTAQIALILHIPNVFSRNIQIGSKEALKHMLSLTPLYFRRGS